MGVNPVRAGYLEYGDANHFQKAGLQHIICIICYTLSETSALRSPPFSVPEPNNTKPLLPGVQISSLCTLDLLVISVTHQEQTLITE